ncbi:tRNA glutamyl-Q(34) synthetase GluQRS [Rhizobium sp. G21]|uniref:tRNA glutamyl-Q(34) synthetase GluQRS n=1 Tax=Rhizobium sp. G21 TaxID=2758439 RepID=UPI0015FF048A|nr:tRNA glutamyl-Q(34) synthetase GluQRS [Rhizobium sp. G21]MBB1249310.1 tRNA glutamyl-Q(34) synthetase GluQRS [Rhizobium sp. G21]
MTPVFRFAPSPNGELHLGHALSAILNHDMARETNGRFLLRIEDIDPQRCRPEFETLIFEDLRWLGLDWEEPVRRQSEHVDVYRDALERLRGMGVVYPAFLSRAEVKRRVADREAQGGDWPRDPDGTPLYPTEERDLDPAVAAARIEAGERHLWRLDMERALARLGSEKLAWLETGAAAPEHIPADPSLWGDVALWRWDAPSSYHLSVVVDDALQGVTHVVRGRDLYWSTPVHRLLQRLLDLPAPTYLHHRLLTDESGQKLSKSLQSTGLRALGQAGGTPSDIRRRIGL